MKTLNTKEQMTVNGGAAHYHWMCSTGHSYWSAARTWTSANAWRVRHNGLYHGNRGIAKMTALCNKGCGKIYTDLP